MARAPTPIFDDLHGAKGKTRLIRRSTKFCEKSGLFGPDSKISN